MKDHRHRQFLAMAGTPTNGVAPTSHHDTRRETSPLTWSSRALDGAVAPASAACTTGLF